MIRRTSSRRPAPSAWNIALCSESTGSTVAPAAAARRMNNAPAQTSHSLLASATVAPRSTAASVGLRPAAPVMRRHHPVGRTLRRFDHGILAGRGLDAGARQRVFQFGIGGRVGDRGKRAPSSRASFASVPALRAAVTASTR